MTDATPADLQTMLFWLGAVLIGFCMVCVIGMGLINLYRFVRMRRRLRKPLPPADDPRNRNTISLRDWKHRSIAAKRFRSAA
jgi:hypothetical protein